jgi:tryptophan synthase beta chain
MKKQNLKNYNLPNESGFFGDFGGRFVPPSLEKPLSELTSSLKHYLSDPQFKQELKNLYQNYANRPSPLYFASRLTQFCDGAQIYLKREDLNHTGAHKINNAIGQALLAKRMGKNKLIAETGAGQHGVATATVAAGTIVTIIIIVVPHGIGIGTCSCGGRLLGDRTTRS